MKAKKTGSFPKLPPEYYVSSRQRNRKKFFERIRPGVMKDLGLIEEKTKKGGVSKRS